MIPEFLLKKYGTEVCQIMMADGRVKGENIRKSEAAPERQSMVASHMQKIVSELELNFPVDNYTWAFDFPGWLGQIDELQHKKYMIIGMEPHIAEYDFQVTYGLSEKCFSPTGVDGAFKLEGDEKQTTILNYDSGLIWSNLFELFASADEKKLFFRRRRLTC